MKFKSKHNPNAQLIDAHLWDPRQPAAQRPQWFNDLVNSGDIIHESTDSLSLAFPAIGSVLPGSYCVRLQNGNLVPAYKTVVEKDWEPVEGQ